MRQVLNISKFEVDCLRQEKNPQAELKKISAENGPEKVAKLLKISEEELPDEEKSPAHENHSLITEADEDDAVKKTDKSLNKDEGFFSWMEGQINKYATGESADEKRGLINKSTQRDHDQVSKRFKTGSSSGEFSQHQSRTLTYDKLVPNEQPDSPSPQTYSDSTQDERRTQQESPPNSTNA